MPEHIEWIETSSTLIKRHRWHDNVLDVEFPNGDCWSYTQVSRETYNSMRNAPSVGQYFWKHIRNNDAYGRSMV